MQYNKPTGDQSTEVYPFIHRRKLMKLFCLAAICLGFALSGCDLGKVDASAETNSKKESNMEALQTNPTIQNKIPPIDAAAAPLTETATFALG
jgi:hypothetical protein